MVNGYHKIRRTIRSWWELPEFVYIGNARVPAKNWMMHRQIFGGGKLVLEYERELIEEAKKFMQRGIFFDIGAGVGYWSYIFASLGCETYAYETDKELQEFIKNVAQRNNLPIKVFGTFEKFGDVIPDFVKIDTDGGEEKIIMENLDVLASAKIGLALEIRNETLFLLDELKKIGYKETKRFGEGDYFLFLKK